MLVAQGVTSVEIWFENGDRPVIVEQTCPRLGVCDVINCYVCYDRWVNVGCYTIYNSGILAGLTLITATAIITMRYMLCGCYLWLSCLLWPCVKLWKIYQRKEATTQARQRDDEEQIEMLIPPSSWPYNPTTVPRAVKKRAVFPGYTGPLALIAVLLLAITAQGCSEFASMAASSTECVESGNLLTTTKNQARS